MLKLKYFSVKPKKYYNNVHENSFDILDLYFIQKLSISEIKRYLEQHKSNSKLAYNTIKNIVEHFKQYTPVLTKENIQKIKISNYLENWGQKTKYKSEFGISLKLFLHLQYTGMILV